MCSVTCGELVYPALVRRRVRLGLLRGVGPEVLAAASDNDPTNVGTAAAVGAQFGYQLCWVALLVAPLLAVVMSIAAQVGIVARDDLQSLTRKRFGRAAASLLLVSVVVVNLVTIAADLMAGAAGIGLLAGVNFSWLVVPLGVALTALLLAGVYAKVVAVLRYLLLGFATFAVAAFMAHPDWARVLRASVVPVLTPGTAAASLALLGTTLTSYVYIWETIARGVEEQPDRMPATLGRAKVGAVAGSVITAVILWFMVIVFAATLGRHHATVSSAGQAAAALKPLAGQGATDVFAVGLITSAVVALPVLIATTAHMVGAQFNWRRGLSEGIGSARRFYAALVASVALALVLALIGISVIGMLEAASVIGGLGTVAGLVLLVRLGRDEQVMGTQVITRRLAAAGWVVAVVMGGLSLLFVVSAALH
jgi:Mn2+/Fe2+ NRAMP family transporter